MSRVAAAEPGAGPRSSPWTAALWRGWRRLPPWAQALAVLAATQALYAFVIARHAELAGPRGDGSFRGYLDLNNNWDGTWYQRVAAEGYPRVLPRGADGVVQGNTWAFYPLFPTLARGVVAVTGWSWSAAAPVVSLSCAALAVLAVRRLVAQLAGPRTALWTVVLLCCFPTALVLQLPYSESLALALLAGVLLCLHQGSAAGYLTAVPLLALAGLARPIGVPLAVVVLVHALRQLRWWRAGQRVLTRADLAALGLLCPVALAAAVEWPLIAAAVTGEPNAYTDTMAAWRSSRRVVPVLPWIQASQHYLGRVVGPVLLLLVLVALVRWLTGPRSAAIAGDQRIWCLAYLGYLVAVMDSFTSLPRYLLPLFPIGTVLVTASPSAAYRRALAVASLALVLVWAAVIWRSHTMAP